MGQLAEPPLGGAGAVHRRGVEEGRTRGDTGVEGTLLLVAARRAATVGELRRGPAGASRRIAPGHRPDSQAGDDDIALAEGRCLLRHAASTTVD